MILEQSAGPLEAKNHVVVPSPFSNINLLLGVLPLLFCLAAGGISFFLLRSNLLQALIPAILALAAGLMSVTIYFFTSNKLKDLSLAEFQNQAREKGISDSNIQLEAILQSIQEGIIITNLHGQITLINKNASSILQREQSTLQNQPVSKVLMIEDLMGKIIKEHEIELQSPTNTKITVKISSFPLVSGGQINGTIYIVTDITQESELAKMKLDFVAQAAHQLRTPLTILRSYLTVFQDKMVGRLNEEEKLYLDRSVIGANQLSDLIENLLNVSKIEQNKLELQLAPVQIDQLVYQVIQSEMPEATSKKVTLKFQSSQGLPQVLVDTKLMVQVLTNLIKNGIEFSNIGGEVVVTTMLQGQEVTVQVNDNGIGIPSEASRNLFTKFFKVTGNLRQESPGIGLGLYNSKAIIEAHHGKIWVNSILGKGSSFGFSLPVTLGANS